MFTILKDNRSQIAGHWRILSLAVLLLFIFSHVLFAGFVQRYSVQTYTPPQFDAWIPSISNAKTTTTNPYRPQSVSGITEIKLDVATGIIARQVYTGTVSTNAKIACWGRKGVSTSVGSWYRLKDVDQLAEIAFTADAGTDLTDGTNYYSTPSNKIDALGAEAVLCTVTTACSGATTCGIELSAY